MGGLGWAEILMILVVALIIFGPRKLPELGKTLGNSLAQFRRASEDFKRTWEDEVETEKRRVQSYMPDLNAPLDSSTESYNNDTGNNDSGTPASESTGDQYDYGYLAGETAETTSTEEAPSEATASEEPALSETVPAESEIAAGSETGEHQSQQQA